MGIDFFRPTILTHFSGFYFFKLDYTIISMNLSHGAMGKPPNSCYNDFSMIL